VRLQRYIEVVQLIAQPLESVFQTRCSENLGYCFHREVASLPPEKQELPGLKYAFSPEKLLYLYCEKQEKNINASDSGFSNDRRVLVPSQIRSFLFLINGN